MLKDTTVLLSKLRQLMQKPPGGIEPICAYIIPTDDAHQSEYICQRDERRTYISGFDGSEGTAVVTMDKALLWTDGRYYNQAGKQLDTNWVLMKDGLPTTPTIGNWLAKHLDKGSKVGVDPKLFSYRRWKPMQKQLSLNECELLGIEKNLVDLIWDNQPGIPCSSVITLDTTLSGKTIKEKFEEVRREMIEKNTEVLIVTALDEIAWFLNMRGRDIDYNPVFFSYLVLTLKDILLFLDPAKLSYDYPDHLKQNNVHIVVRNYDQIKNQLTEIISKTEGRIWIAPSSSYYLTTLIPKNKRFQEITPIALMKAIKNPTEVNGMINSHVRDGLAVCQYLAWLEKSVNNGVNVDEISGATKLESFRKQRERYMGLSFSTISASGPNGSVIHYHPRKETNRQITDKELYLVDSGGQYMDGTTDITRTVHFGTPTDFEKECFTRVLKGQLTMGSLIFPKKTKGQMIDALARKALWDVGLDYRHGTGHGIGHFLNVHEGPMGIGIRLMPDDPGLQENMFVSNEPGYYEDGKFGIRIEDIVQIVPADISNDFAGRGALTFKTITMCPKQTKLIKRELLTNVEIKLLNDYHQEVNATLRPLLEKLNDQVTLEWLDRETVPI